VLHGLGHAVLPMRATEVPAPGALPPATTLFYVVAMVGFVAAGLGILGVRPLSRAVIPIVAAAGFAGLAAQLAAAQAGFWPGVVLSLTLPILAVLYDAVVARDAQPTRHRPVWKRLGDTAGVLFLAWIAASAVLWPWHRGWGTATDEWTMALPGDHVPRTPQFEILHAVTIDAPPSAVWPWLVQLGHDRAGFYSYDWLERLFMADVHNVKEIRPEWQRRESGDAVYATQAGYLGGFLGHRPGWIVALIEPEHAMVLENWGAFVLMPTSDGRTRFLIRSTISNPQIPVWGAVVNLTAFQLPHFIMQRKMMLTIKALSERSSEADS
jgi:hypothetical protein